MIEVIVGAIRLEAQDIHSFELFRADGAALPSFEPGAHIDLHLPNGLVRQYSLCGPAERPRHYRIAVLRCRDCAAARPRCTPNCGSASGCASASRAISSRCRRSPVRACCSPAASASRRCWRWPNAWPAMAPTSSCTTARIPPSARPSSTILTGAPSPTAYCHFDHGDSRRRADLRALLAASPRDAQLYLCGPAGFMQWIEESARELGWEASRLHREHFAAAPRDANADGTFEVQLASNGALIRVAAGQTVLAALREAGVDLPASCEQGICGTCLTRVLDGEPEHRDLYLSEEEQAANDCFTPCCSRSRSPRLVLDL